MLTHEPIIANNQNVETIVYAEINRLGQFADLNHIDVSEVTNFSNLFQDSEFQGDISKWNMRNAIYLMEMFDQSRFNGDISAWSLASAKHLDNMFRWINKGPDISQWYIEMPGSNSPCIDGMLQVEEYDSPTMLFPRFNCKTPNDYCKALNTIYGAENGIWGNHQNIYRLLQKAPLGYHHAVVGVLFSEILKSDAEKRARVHPHLHLEDIDQILTMYHVTNHVHEAAVLWEQTRRMHVDNTLLLSY